MDLVFIPTLQHMALAKIATSIISTRDINQPSILIRKLYTNRVENLPLPKPLKKEISRFLKPINEEMEMWYQHLQREFNLTRRGKGGQMTAKEVRWTSAGTVARQKSAALLIAQNPRFSLKLRYKLACYYCLADEIFELLLQRESLGAGDGDILTADENEDELVVLWTLHFNQAENRMKRGKYFSSSAFQSALSRKNPTAIKYFFGKLSSKQKRKHVFSACKQLLENFNSVHGCDKNCFVEIFILFLSSMNENERMTIFENYHQVLIPCFLVWPYYNWFLELSVSRGLIAPDKFFVCLDAIFYKMDHDDENCVYRDLLGDFWQCSPMESKNYVFDYECYFFLELFINLVEVGELDLCRMMLKDADAERKEKIFLHDEAQSVYKEQLRRRKNAFIEFLREEVFVSSAEEKEKFEEIIRKSRINLRLHYQFYADIWRMIFE